MNARISTRFSMSWAGLITAVSLSLAVGLLLGLGSFTPGAQAEPTPVPPSESGDAPEVAPVPDTMPDFGDSDSEAAPGGHTYVAEILDSLFVVGPAQFFALDMPPDPPGARAIHLSGTVTVTDKKGDIQVRLFRAADYTAWLKKRGGDKSGPLWSSKRSRNITVDHDLRKVGPCVLLLDNGYSMRTAKHARTQLQIQYQRINGSAATPASTMPGAPAEDDIVTPRANTEDETPPPPPPPADEATK